MASENIRVAFKGEDPAMKSTRSKLMLSGFCMEVAMLSERWWRRSHPQVGLWFWDVDHEGGVATGFVAWR